MALLLGIVAALFLGGSDFFGAKTSRLVPSVTVTRTALLSSAMLAPLLLLLKPVEWGARDIGIAALSGLALALALSLLYKGYSSSPVGIIAPTTSVLLAAVPVAYDFIRGERPSLIAVIGMALGISALVLTSYTPGGNGSISTALIIGCTAGLFFGVGFTLMDYTDDSSGLMPVLIQRSVGFAVLALMQLRDHHPLIATKPPARRLGFITGALAVIAIGALQLGYRYGSAGPVSVATSQFATVAVILSFLFNKERLRWWQGVGVGATAVGVALMAVG
jgi:drug/metabolite transporter (DMT)-like permease